MLATRRPRRQTRTFMPITPSPAVLRACDLLEHLAAHPSESFSVSELARSVEVPRATCDSVLLALADRGLVHRDPDLRYSLGAGCRALGDAAAAAGAPLNALEPIADALARATGSCVAISTSNRGETRIERVFDHGPAFGLRTRVGESVALVAPFGAVFVAWDDDDAIETWVDRATGPLVGEDCVRAREALAAVRARGYSISLGVDRPDRVRARDHVSRHGSRNRLDARGALMSEIPVSEYLAVAVADDRPHRMNHISAPVFDATGEVVYAFMMLGPSYDLTGREITALGKRVLTATRDATDRIGGKAP